MVYLEQFQGVATYEAALSQLADRRQAVITQAEAFKPANIDELLAASEENDVDVKLEWVTIPDPRAGTSKQLTVQPILEYAGKDEGLGRDTRLFRIMVVGKLPSGDERVLGQMYFFRHGSETHSSFGLDINMSLEANSTGSGVSWESADAGLFLTVLELALVLQPPKPAQNLADKP